MVKTIILIFCALAGLSCGVKGDPQPPAEMPQLGRGKPTFDKASKELIEKEKNREEEAKGKKK
jgi:hypothetical protein